MTPPPLQSLLDPLKALLELFARAKIKGVIIGGVAASLLSKPRFTADVDAVAHLTDSEIPMILSCAHDIGLVPRVKDPLSFARRNNVLLLKHAASGIAIDISLAMLPFEIETIERATRVTIRSLTFSIPTPEDLVIMKAVAHRPRDLGDIEAILMTHPNLNLRRVRRWIREFEHVLNTPEIKTDFEKIVQRLKKNKKGHAGI